MIEGMRLRTSLPCIALLAAVEACAAPMGFKDSHMVMGDFSRNWREAGFNHAFTARDAFGMGAMWMRADDGSHTREIAEVTYVRLVARWNLPSAQGNIWFLGSAGGMRGSDFSGTHAFVAPGLQLDYETRRIYLAALARWYRAGSVAVTPGDEHSHVDAGRTSLNHDYTAVRAGFSFWEVEYEQTQPWFVVEARRMEDMMDGTEVTPMLRLINRRWFIEGGVTNQGHARLKFMYTF
jgi:hypothetical protein